MPVATLIYCRRGLLGSLIRRWPSDAPDIWSHVGIFLPAPIHGLGIRPAVVWHATFAKGFHETPAEEFFRTYRKSQHVHYRVEGDWIEQRDWCHDRAGVPYAWKTVAARAVGVNTKHRGRMQCAQAGELFLRDMRCTQRLRADLHMASPDSSYQNMAGVIP